MLTIKSKLEMTKPNIYIANVMGPENDPLDVAHAIEVNPFVNSIYTLGAVYPADVVLFAPDQILQDISVRTEVELMRADIVIVDLRNGEPIEMGHALAKQTPMVLYNPNRGPINPLIYGRYVIEVATLDELSDLNYLKIHLTSDG